MKFWQITCENELYYKILTTFNFLCLPYADLARKFNTFELNEILDQLFESSVCADEFSLKNFLFVCKSDDIAVISHKNYYVFTKILGDNVINAPQNAPYFDKTIGFLRSVQILSICDKSTLDPTLQEFLDKNSMHFITQISDDKICSLIVSKILNQM